MSVTSFDPERLRDVQTPEDLVLFLAEDLDWPVGSADLERLTFDYTPADLGIPDEDVPKLLGLRQLRPLTTTQPWGIFFVELSGPRLSITPLRRLLRGLVTRKRARSDGHRTWALDDLLFFTTTDDGSGLELHLLAFFEAPDGGQPEIRSLAWSPKRSTPLHLKRLATELLGRLEWPADPNDPDGWRIAWRAAFRLRHGEALTSAARLAERMAEVARRLRATIGDELLTEDGEGPFTTLLEEVREELVSGLDLDGFADMCAQTLVSGALTARVLNPVDFGASPVLEAVPLGSSFLSSFFAQVSDEIAAIDLLDAAGMDALVADLRQTNIEAVLDEFGSSAAGGDPVIHFYERFLAAYDPGIRARVGAYFTPQPVVDCIVGLVDEVLRSRFGLVEGAADQGTWAEVAARTGLAVPDNVDPEQPFVSVLDPATGTGTFLVSWLRRARASFGDRPADAWQERLRIGILPRLRAFELLLGPYAIAQLKIALEAGADNADAVTDNVLLTDTLELPGPVARLDGLDPVAREGERAAVVKRDGRPTIIVGNPPYGRVQRGIAGGWVANGTAGRPALMQDFIDLANARTIFSHVASLYDQYVYFWRWAIWKLFEQPGTDAPGVIAMITGATWLDGPGFVGLREAARALCSEVWILDLGGDGRGTDPEENVFDIQTPVVITVMVRAEPTDEDAPARIYYRRMRGSQAEKLAAVTGVQSPDRQPDVWTELPSSVYEPLKPAVGDAAWAALPALTDLLCWQQPGAMLNRTWPVAPDQRTLRRRWDTFLADDNHAARARIFPDPNSGRRIDTHVGSLATLKSLPPGAEPQEVAPYQWRPFDRQWTFRDPRLAKTESPALWQTLGARQLFLATLNSAEFGAGPAVAAFAAAPDKHVFNGRGGKDILPLYRDVDGAKPNVPTGLLEQLAATPEELLAYVYALLATPGYQLRFQAELADRVARVPLTLDAALFAEAVALGSELLWLHTFGDRYGEGRSADLPQAGVTLARTITRLPRDKSELFHDQSQALLSVADGAITGVGSEVWSYAVSGWPVVPRWLEHRTAKGRGKRLSELDLIRPDSWSEAWTDELLSLLRALTRSIDLQPAQDDLLARICAGPLVRADELPTPTAAERTVPPTLKSDVGQMGL